MVRGHGRRGGFLFDTADFCRMREVVHTHPRCGKGTAKEENGWSGVISVSHAFRLLPPDQRWAWNKEGLRGLNFNHDHGCPCDVGYDAMMDKVGCLLSKVLYIYTP